MVPMHLTEADNIISVEGIGKIRVVRTYRGKYLRLQVDREAGVKMTVPVRVSMKEAEKWLERKKPWLRKKIGEIKRQQASQTVFLPGRRYFTRTHLLLLEPWAGKGMQLRIRGITATLNYPENADPAAEPVQQIARRALVQVLRREASVYLPERLDFLARRHGFSYRKVSIRENRSRWGSCSGKDHISLNLHLMRLPDHLIDYVLLHELLHTVHRNHGPLFWAELDRLTGGARKLDRELKKYPVRYF